MIFLYKKLISCFKVETTLILIQISKIIIIIIRCI